MNFGFLLLDLLNKLVPAFAAVFTGTAWVAFLTYRYQLRLQRLKWLQGLYDDFYKSEQHKLVRQQIDFDDLEKLLALLDRSEKTPQALAQNERDEIDRFTDYLNFFEWLAFLEKQKQFSFEDLDVMFKYYLVRLLQVDKGQRIRKYIRGKGYEQLNGLLNRYSAMGR